MELWQEGRDIRTGAGQPPKFASFFLHAKAKLGLTAGKANRPMHLKQWCHYVDSLMI